MDSRVKSATAAAVQRRPAQAAPRRRVVHVLESVGHTFGSIFFIPNPWIGLILALALVSEPRLLGFAIEGLVVGAAVNHMLGFTDEPGSGGGVRTNAMLATVVTGWLLAPSGLQWQQQLLVAAAAALPASLIAAALVHFLARSIVPAVLVAYCIAAALLFELCPQCTVSASAAMQPWPLLTNAVSWGEAFLRSLAALLYAQDWASGAFVALAVLAWSPAMFVFGAVGWLGGAIAALVFAQLHLTYVWLPLSYNFFVAGLALGAGLFVPDRSSVPVAFAAGAVASFFAVALQYALGWSSASYLPLSSALAIWVGIGALSNVRERAIPVAAGGAHGATTPERQCWQLAYWRARFGADVPLLAVPVAGDLVVTQGFDGATSHIGALRHAVDFERPGPGHGIPGAIFGAEVHAPIAGTVERVCNDIADNAPGVCNYAQPWGNHVSIRIDGDRGWVLLAHLQQDSIVAAPGTRVESGTYLGRVGNSGRSAFSHLHVQVQSAPEPGSPTKQFRFANYLRRGTNGQPACWIASKVPAAGEIVCASVVNPAVYQMLCGIAPGTGVWTAHATGKIPRAFRSSGRQARMPRLRTTIDPMGRHVFATPDGGHLTWRLDPDGLRAVELAGRPSPLLALLALAAPTVPYCARPGLQWSDMPPLPPALQPLRSRMLALAPYLNPRFAAITGACIGERPDAGATVDLACQPEPRSRRLPVKVSCAWSALRGPVRISAEFAHGALHYSLLSFDAAGSPAATPS